MINYLGSRLPGLGLLSIVAAVESMTVRADKCWIIRGSGAVQPCWN